MVSKADRVAPESVYFDTFPPFSNAEKSLRKVIEKNGQTLYGQRLAL